MMATGPGAGVLGPVFWGLGSQSEFARLAAQSHAMVDERAAAGTRRKHGEP